MEELDPRLAGTADYLRKIVAQLASIVSRLDPETTYEACARADDERNKRLAKIENQMAMTLHNVHMLQVSMSLAVERLNTLEKRNTTIDNLCGRLEVLEKDVKNNNEITDFKLDTLSSSINDLDAGFADIKKRFKPMRSFKEVMRQLKGSLTPIEYSRVVFLAGGEE